MAGKAAVVALFACSAIAGLLAACFDVLHDTGTLQTACELDASSPGCAREAGSPATSCAPTRQAAVERARHACAWLGACKTPGGENAFGSCMFAAMMAFDCDSNRNHPARGRAASAWACLAAATTCNDVDACVARDTSSCGGVGAFVACTVPAACAPGMSCAGSVIQDCTADGSALVIDCAGSGRQACDGFPAGDAQWVACVPEADAAAKCAADLSATCDRGVAHSCPAGVPESLDCGGLLVAARPWPDAGPCREGRLAPAFDWTSACAVDPPQCSADACDGGVLTGCGRGAAFDLDCFEAGLRACSMVRTDPGSAMHAACTAP